MKHLKTPWDIGIETNSEHAQIINSQGEHVAMVGIYPLQEHVDLIIAAPELFDALQNLVWRYENYANESDEECKFMNTARAVLLKAKAGVA